MTGCPTPSAEQERAITAIDAWWADASAPQEFFLDGEAGVGKSFTSGAAVNRLRNRRGKKRVHTVAAGAYTAKAALVMQRKGVEAASTIHGMIYRPDRDKRTGRLCWRISEESPAAHADIIVIDECSMVNNRMADDLRSFGKKILVLGDVRGQLPPIEGGGAFTNREPDFRLLEPNRFALSSPIMRLGRLARNNEPLPFGTYRTDGDGPECTAEVLPLTKETWREIYRPGTQVLCGTHATRWKVSQLLRQQAGFSGPVPLRSERIICCQNGFDLGLINGALGTMSSDAGEEDGRLMLSVDMENLDCPLDDLPTHPYLFQQHFVGPIKRPLYQQGVHEFDWGYALTVHKFQGSEAPHITLIDDSAAFRDADMRRRWLYTGVTRAAEGLTILRRT